MRVLKNVIIVVIFAIAVILAFSGLFALINGSLESAPTLEQQEKARIAGALLLVVGLVMAFIGRLLCKKR